MFDVLLHGKLVGTLQPRGRGVRFTYYADVVEDPSVPPISLSMPKQVSPYADSKAGPFFRNLLPEQAYRRLVATAIGVAQEDDLALLGAIGGECPGAVSIWPQGERPPSPPAYRAVSDTEIEELFDEEDRLEMAAALSRGRLSLAGAQEKIALYHDGDSWSLPLNGAITSHILKQSTMRFSHLLENELCCATLAGAAGLNVVSAGLASENVRVFTTRRFDRQESGGSLHRLHQEDFCQALGVDPSRKYEHDGGPGIKRCAQTILRYSAAPIIDLDRLVRWVGFNYLVGNEDAHAKNLALLYGADGTRLAPYYDIVSTGVYESLERKLSMKIGRSWDARNVQASDWQMLARAVDLPWPVVKEALAEVAARVSEALPDVVESVTEEYGVSPVYGKIGRTVAEKNTQLQRELARRRSQ